MLAAPRSDARIVREAAVSEIVRIRLDAPVDSGFVRVLTSRGETVWVKTSTLRVWLDAPGLLTEAERLEARSRDEFVVQQQGSPASSEAAGYQMMRSSRSIPLNGVAMEGIAAPSVRNFADGDNWMLMSPMWYKVGEGPVTITVPRGFVTDFASIPRIIRPVLGATGRYSGPATLHDYLYWAQTCTRDESDALFYRAMRESGVSATVATTFYLAVHFEGDKAWQANRADRRRGLVRTVPAGWDTVVSRVPWDGYREVMKFRGVSENTSGAIPRATCALGSKPLGGP